MPPNDTDFTANSMTILSFTFSLRLSCVTSSVTSRPAGIVAPFEPDTAFARLAVKVCPTV